MGYDECESFEPTKFDKLEIQVDETEQNGETIYNFVKFERRDDYGFRVGRTIGFIKTKEQQTDLFEKFKQKFPEELL